MNDKIIVSELKKIAGSLVSGHMINATLKSELEDKIKKPQVKVADADELVKNRARTQYQDKINYYSKNNESAKNIIYVIGKLMPKIKQINKVARQLGASRLDSDIEDTVMLLNDGLKDITDLFENFIEEMNQSNSYNDV